MHCGGEGGATYGDGDGTMRGVGRAVGARTIISPLKTV